VYLGQPEGVFVVVWLYALEEIDEQEAEDLAHTGQSEQLVADENGRLVLVFVQSILSPIAQELFHGVFRLAMLEWKMMLCGADDRSCIRAVSVKMH
jgi:hypothetical protein